MGEREGGIPPTPSDFRISLMHQQISPPQAKSMYETQTIICIFRLLHHLIKSRFHKCAKL